MEEKKKIELELTAEEDIKICFKKDNLLIFRKDDEVVFVNFKTRIRAKI